MCIPILKAFKTAMSVSSVNIGIFCILKQIFALHPSYDTVTFRAKFLIYFSIVLLYYCFNCQDSFVITVNNFKVCLSKNMIKLFQITSPVEYRQINALTTFNISRLLNKTIIVYY